jgi:hypothetical protein
MRFVTKDFVNIQCLSVSMEIIIFSGLHKSASKQRSAVIQLGDYKFSPGLKSVKVSIGCFHLGRPGMEWLAAFSAGKRTLIQKRRLIFHDIMARRTSTIQPGCRFRVSYTANRRTFSGWLDAIGYSGA